MLFQAESIVRVNVELRLLLALLLREFEELLLLELEELLLLELEKLLPEVEPSSAFSE